MIYVIGPQNRLFRLRTAREFIPECYTIRAYFLILLNIALMMPKIRGGYNQI